jgi:2-methylaconitate cis-trans-isomerase PrpF
MQLVVCVSLHILVLMLTLFHHCLHTSAAVSVKKRVFVPKNVALNQSSLLSKQHLKITFNNSHEQGMFQMMTGKFWKNRCKSW